jgi:hypothetical protein
MTVDDLLVLLNDARAKAGGSTRVTFRIECSESNTEKKSLSGVYLIPFFPARPDHYLGCDCDGAIFTIKLEKEQALTPQES